MYGVLEARGVGRGNVTKYFVRRSTEVMSTGNSVVACVPGTRGTCIEGGTRYKVSEQLCAGNSVSEVRANVRCRAALTKYLT